MYTKLSFSFPEGVLFLKKLKKQVVDINNNLSLKIKTTTDPSKDKNPL